MTHIQKQLRLIGYLVLARDYRNDNKADAHNRDALDIIQDVAFTLDEKDLNAQARRVRALLKKRKIKMEEF